jgi:hypothetical protein
MRAKFLAASFFALGLLFQPAAAEASVVQLPLNGNVVLVSSGGFLTVGINDIQISEFPTFDLSNFGEFTFAYALIQANFNILDATGSSINSLSGSNSLFLEFDNCPFCPHPVVPHQLTYLLPVGQFELDITSSSEGHSNSGSTVQIGYGIFASSDAVAAIPEPSTWAMLLIGFAGVGFVAYQRRRASSMSSAAAIACGSAARRSHRDAAGIESRQARAGTDAALQARQGIQGHSIAATGSSR